MGGAAGPWCSSFSRLSYESSFSTLRHFVVYKVLGWKRQENLHAYIGERENIWNAVTTHIMSLFSPPMITDKSLRYPSATQGGGGGSHNEGHEGGLERPNLSPLSAWWRRSWRLVCRRWVLPAAGHGRVVGSSTSFFSPTMYRFNDSLFICKTLANCIRIGKPATSLTGLSFYFGITFHIKVRQVYGRDCDKD